MSSFDRLKNSSIGPDLFTPELYLHLTGDADLEGLLQVPLQFDDAGNPLNGRGITRHSPARVLELMAERTNIELP